MSYVMRDIEIRPYVEGQPYFRLQLIDTGLTGEYGKRGIGYRLAEYGPRGGFRGVIFAHEKHGIIWHPGVIDDDRAVGEVLNWLTLRPGDTDSEFFDDYTKRQLDFANEHAETLGLYGLEWAEELEHEAYEGFEDPREWSGDDAYEELQV